MAATRVKADKSLIVPLGLFKMEVIPLTGVIDGNTIESRLASPSYAFMVPAADAGGTSTNPSVTISGKTLTLNDPPVTAVTVVVFGDGLA